LSDGREMDRDLVFISHPKTNFDSSILFSAISFFKEIMSFLGIGSRGSYAIEMEGIPSGMA
jgi:hypothetical protein